MTVAVRDQLERLLKSLSEKERREALDLVASSLRPGTSDRKFQSLEGIWKDRFPPDFDVEAALREIRGEWQRDQPE